jgi:S-DNA-T family DNA segregation ATPase FtsK/SpoIIIE
VAERLGAWIDGFIESRREKREVAQDLAVGQRAAREREEIVLEERIEIEEHHPTPVMIEPVLVDVPKSERVAKERQKPLFTECPTASCRRWTCWTARSARKPCRPKRWK